MRSATLLAFVDWRPSAVKSTILSGVDWAVALVRRLARASLRDGASQYRVARTRRRASAGSPAGSRQGLWAAFQRWGSATSLRRFRPSGGVPEDHCAWLWAVTNTLFRKDPRDKSRVDRAGSSWIITWFKRLLWRVECIISGSRSSN